MTISFALGEINCPLLIVNYQLSIVNCLKFLSDDKVEIASASLRAAVWAVETVGPVDTHQSDHWKEDADADAGRPFQVERIEVFQIRPCVTGFDEDQSVDGRRGFEQERVAQLHREARVGISVGRSVTGDTTVLVSAQSDGLGRVGAGVAAHAVTSHVEGFERGALVLIVGPQEAVFNARHQHRRALHGDRVGQRGEDFRLEFPLVVFNHAVLILVLVAHVRVVLAVPQRPRRRSGNGKHELRTATGVERVVDRVTLDVQFQVDVVAVAVLHEEVVPVFHHVELVVQGRHELEVVVRPVQPAFRSRRRYRTS